MPEPLPESISQPILESVPEPEPETIHPETEPALHPLVEPAAQSEPVPSIGDFEQTVIESGRNSEDLISGYEKEEFENLRAEPAKEAEKTLAHSIVISAESAADDTVNSVLIINEETGDIEEKIFYMDPGFSAGSDYDSDIDEPESPPEPYTESEPRTRIRNPNPNQYQNQNLNPNQSLNPKQNPNPNPNQKLIFLQSKSRLILSTSSFCQIHGLSNGRKKRTCRLKICLYLQRKNQEVL